MNGYLVSIPIYALAFAVLMLGCIGDSNTYYQAFCCFGCLCVGMGVMYSIQNVASAVCKGGSKRVMSIFGWNGMDLEVRYPSGLEPKDIVSFIQFQLSQIKINPGHPIEMPNCIIIKNYKSEVNQDELAK